MAFEKCSEQRGLLSTSLNSLKNNGIIVEKVGERLQFGTKLDKDISKALVGIPS